jgi:carbon storage regulator
MLLITRRSGEGIVINDSIEVTIVEIKGGRVKLGFEYPEGNTVYRKELFVKIQAENKAAATGFGRIDQLITAITSPQASTTETSEPSTKETKDDD